MYSARVLLSSSVHNNVTFASESAVPAGLQLRLCYLTTTDKKARILIMIRSTLRRRRWQRTRRPSPSGSGIMRRQTTRQRSASLPDSTGVPDCYSLPRRDDRVCQCRRRRRCSSCFCCCRCCCRFRRYGFDGAEHS
ncbi:hypothetical protein T492DRAFT_902053, partial [Pavlovales sp. CCMP2436]